MACVCVLGICYSSLAAVFPGVQISLIVNLSVPDGLLEVNRRRKFILDHSALNEMAGDTLQGRINRE